jgi:4-diphosphocytidyl-2-C-methyl-D-erythritol kinase
MTLPNEFPSITDIVTFLNMTQNDLTLAAQENIPAIKTILQTLKDQDSVRLARMSGSGSACFGIFETPALADNAAQAIKNLHPQWWIQAVQIS